MKRNKITTYIIGAGVAGTIIVLPYFLLVIRLTTWQSHVPFFLLPLVWGLWNSLYIRLRHPVSIGAWGALLGFILSLAVNVLLYAYSHWSFLLLFGLVVAPAIYYVIWNGIIGPLNKALSVDE